MKTERSFPSQTLPPYLGVPQFDIRQTFLGSESDSRTHPSIFTAAPNAWRHQVLLRQDLQVCSRAQLTRPDISDDEGRTERIHTSCLDYAHTHIRVHSRQTDTANIHTRETYLVETGQMFYLSVRVSECCAPSDGGVLISGAGSSARRHGCCDGDRADKLHHADHGGSRLYAIYT